MTPVAIIQAIGEYIVIPIACVAGIWVIFDGLVRLDRSFRGKE